MDMHSEAARETTVEPRDRLGRHLRDLRVSVTDRCNFRCRYCMPREEFGPDFAFLEREDLLTFEEIARVVAACVPLGVRKVRITGGEPLVRRGLDRLVALLRGVHGVEDLAMTTNGSRLAPLATPLHEAGLDRVTVSLDALDDDTFRAMSDVRVPVAAVVEGIDAAIAAGLGVKVNTVVQRGANEHAIEPLARFARDRGVTVRFIEYMDVGTTNGWSRDEVVPAAEILDRLAAVSSLEPLPATTPGEVANRYRYTDGVGEVGVIASVTQPFCRACVRARLSPIGELFTCLFATSGSDLRALLRGGADDETLAETITAIWEGRSDRYSELRAGVRRELPKVEMSYIGG